MRLERLPEPAIALLQLAAVLGRSFPVRDLEALGPTFVKIGQALSTRPDLVAPEYLQALERIQDHVAPVPPEDIRVALEQALGVKAATVFPEFEPVPIGSASLAQVHRARLRDGRRVAVKVQRPGMDAAIRLDLEVLSGLAGTADALTETGRRMRFAGWIAEFRKILLLELDYRREAENLERFGERLAAYPHLYVPAPVWFRTGAAVGVFHLGLWFGAGLPWWKLLGWW